MDGIRRRRRGTARVDVEPEPARSPESEAAGLPLLRVPLGLHPRTVVAAPDERRRDAVTRIPSGREAEPRRRAVPRLPITARRGRYRRDRPAIRCRGALVAAGVAARPLGYRTHGADGRTAVGLPAAPGGPTLATPGRETPPRTLGGADDAGRLRERSAIPDRGALVGRRSTGGADVGDGRARREHREHRRHRLVRCERAALPLAALPTLHGDHSAAGERGRG